MKTGDIILHNPLLLDVSLAFQLLVMWVAISLRPCPPSAASGFAWGGWVTAFLFPERDGLIAFLN
jgi:hypothetical protein